MDSIEWRKATRSGNNGACVEVGRLDDHTIGVRDSKDHGHGPILRFTHAEWATFLDGVANGEFNLHQG